MLNNVSFASEEIRSRLAVGKFCLAVPLASKPPCAVVFKDGIPTVDKNNSDIGLLKRLPGVFLWYVIAASLDEGLTLEQTKNLIKETINDRFVEQKGLEKKFDWKNLTLENGEFILPYTTAAKSLVFSKERPDSKKHVMKFNCKKKGEFVVAKVRHNSEEDTGEPVIASPDEVGAKQSQTEEIASLPSVARKDREAAPRKDEISETVQKPSLFQRLTLEIGLFLNHPILYVRACPALTSVIFVYAAVVARWVLTGHFGIGLELMLPIVAECWLRDYNAEWRLEEQRKRRKEEERNEKKKKEIDEKKDEVDKDEILKGYDHLNKGDMVITNHCNRTVKKIRDNGIYVVSVTANYITNEFRPEGFSHPNQDNLMLKDVSNEILHSHVPYDQGLVHCPEIPEFTLCPSSGVGQGSLFWMLAAEIATVVADKKSQPGEQASRYLRLLTERVKMIQKTHMGLIREAAVEMAHRIMDGGRWFARSPEHPGIASEVNGVASGPMIVNWGDWKKSLRKNVMTIGAISPAYPDVVKLAKEKQLEGAFVIGIGPGSVNDVEPSGRIIDIADIGFDNFSP